MEFLALVENVVKESRNDISKAGACAAHAGFKLEAVRRVKAGQAVVVAAKAPGIPKASQSNRVRLVAKGRLDDGDATGKPVKATPEQMEIARLSAEAARLRMERAIAKAVRYAWIRPMRRQRPVGVSCEVPEVGVGG